MFDFFMFMGQSNMAGRGISCERWQEKAPELIEGAGWEFRAVSDPERLYKIEEPFGLNENRQEGIWEPGMKTGSMVTAFVNAYYEQSKIPVLAVSASKGGSVIAQWQNRQDYLTDALARRKSALEYCKKNDIALRHHYMVWCQGESDGDKGTTAEEYKERFERLWQCMKKDGIERCFLIAIGKYNGAEPIDYSIINQAQHQIAAEHPEVVLVSDDFGRMKERGLMKDAYHYYQAAYNEVGTISGKNTAKYVNTIS